MLITSAFSPGTLGEIIKLHGQHYAQHWGFGTFFEAKVAQELACFAGRASETDLILVATDSDGVAASLILDLHDPESGTRGAHLRWFIAADRCRGTGIGRQFMDRAIAHADEYAQGCIWLPTFAGLHAARHLYESYGFKLALETEGQAWGVTVTEQEFHRQPSA